jgi:glycosyltransferase involved in cell wall biosynthesis
MKFSLIICTINRTKEVEKLLTSLMNQSYNNFEIIIVDQNKDDRVLKIIEKFSDLTIRYLTSEIGLSKARNIGLKSSIGNLVGFPDDDCPYPRKLLENIDNFFLSNNYDILMGKTINKKNNKIVAGKQAYLPSVLKPNNILGSSTTLFIKKDNIEILFDERFGLGAVFNAEEENDLVFRLLKSGISGYYNPDLNFVYHPPSDLDYSNTKRAIQRGIGLGAFIAKHIFTLEGIGYFFKYNLIRPLSGGILYFLKLNFLKSKFYFYKFLGIWKGFYLYFRVIDESNL